MPETSTGWPGGNSRGCAAPPNRRILLVAFHHEAKALLKLQGAAGERQDLVGRVVQKLEVRADQVQRAEQAE